jgi:hypothetical protein
LFINTSKIQNELSEAFSQPVPTCRKAKRVKQITTDELYSFTNRLDSFHLLFLNLIT